MTDFPKACLHCNISLQENDHIAYYDLDWDRTVAWYCVYCKRLLRKLPTYREHQLPEELDKGEK